MSEKKEIARPPPFDLNAKWDACQDLMLRRFAYSSVAGAFAGLVFFRSPVTRWASLAFGAGIGIGSAYTECSQKFEGSSPAKPVLSKVSESLEKPVLPKVSESLEKPVPPTVSESPAHQDGEE